MLWQLHPLTLTLKEAPQGPQYVTDVAEILYGNERRPTINALEKAVGPF